MLEFKHVAEDDWNIHSYPIGEDSFKRGLNSIRYAVSMLAQKSTRVLEVGPISTHFYSGDIGLEIAQSHQAPIKLVPETIDDTIAAATGVGRSIPEDLIRNTVGNVPYFNELLTPEYKNSGNKSLEALGGQPHVIYGGHVFESSGPSKSLPFGPYKPFARSCELLAEGGYLIIDNGGGQRSQLAVESHWPSTKLVKPSLALDYQSWDENIVSIFMFKKENNIQKL